ncbi:hypothetical protein NDU88_002188 [Pleurodeles waltl]|uniref:Uncharacterized protein n=1 Tax=Pleurodeles waltl TaxID=8319 RepID=A0AAV7SCI5_PLEWA|nr:hypothetical protein NDU88_002188 [Pleurodeles waltl]
MATRGRSRKRREMDRERTAEVRRKVGGESRRQKTEVQKNRAAFTHHRHRGPPARATRPFSSTADSLWAIFIHLLPCRLELGTARRGDATLLLGSSLDAQDYRSAHRIVGPTPDRADNCPAATSQVVHGLSAFFDLRRSGDRPVNTIRGAFSRRGNPSTPKLLSSRCVCKRTFAEQQRGMAALDQPCCSHAARRTPPTNIPKLPASNFSSRLHGGPPDTGDATPQAAVNKGITELLPVRGPSDSGDAIPQAARKQMTHRVGRSQPKRHAYSFERAYRPLLLMTMDADA